MGSTGADVHRLHELLYEALETEASGIQVYEAALECVCNEDLRAEWQEYLAQTRMHHEVLLGVFEELGLDAARRTAGAEVAGLFGGSLVEAMRMAQTRAAPDAAERVACECVVFAETKDHLNWQLIGHVADHIGARVSEVLKRAHAAVAREEDHHLFHGKGWLRELWIEALGLPAVLPPPEELRQVETAIGASRAEQSREQMLGQRKHRQGDRNGAIRQEGVREGRARHA